ncbi:hypothetical protein [Pseudonocardia sp. NPDC049635]|uniref:hypothetical protein n=1 Tax=Pseudonocardia sp. NPDC049635 TaxID=3155506 RepID=UPI00340D87C8
MPGSPSFRTRTVTLPPGGSRPHHEDEWRGALIVVDAGVIELRCTAGGRRRFGAGSVLWFTGLDLVLVHNPGERDAVFRGITRRTG